MSSQFITVLVIFNTDVTEKVSEFRVKNMLNNRVYRIADRGHREKCSIQKYIRNKKKVNDIIVAR